MAKKQLVITILATMEEGARAFFPSSSAAPIDVNHLLRDEGWRVASVHQMTPVTSSSASGKPTLGCTMILEKDET